jgi:Cu-Zn family superoxide dismutase
MKKQVAATLAVFTTPVLALSGCNSNASDSSNTTTSASGAQSMTTQMNTADGKHVADATIDFANGFATVTVQANADSGLSPGFHGLHIHAVGTCEGDFASAGEHFQAPGHTGQPASGDLPPLLVRSDGAGKLVATTDGFTEDQLKGAQGSSIVLHQGAHMNGDNSPDAEVRTACGVLSPASATNTSVSTSVQTSTVTTTAAVVPPATITETTSPTTTETTSTTTPSPSTSTSTVTVTESTPTETTTGPNG